MEGRKSLNGRGGAPALLPAAFGLTFCLTLLVYILQGVAPFGDHTMLYSDAGTQYLSFWVYFRDAFLGRQDFSYALEKTLGGNLAGLYAYYGASPFELLFLLFPKEQAPLAMHLIVLLKLSCCSLTMALYFRYSGGLSRRDLLFTTAYAFCGYNVNYFWSAMWLDGVILLPLIALGLRRLFAGKRPWLYLFSLSAAILFNYYIGFMLCLFSVLYTLLLLWNGWKGVREFPWKRAGVFCLSSLAAGLLPAFLLLPAVSSIQGGKAESFGGLLSWFTYSGALRVLGDLIPGRAEQFDSLVKYVLLAALLGALLIGLTAVLLFRSRRVPEWGKMALLAGLVLLALACRRYFETGTPFIHKLLVGASGFYETLDGNPNLYVGILPLVLAMAYFLNGRIPVRERMGAVLLVLVLLFSMRFYIPNLIWHGFTANNCFNYRYSFVFSFFLLTLAKEAMDRAEGFRPWHAAVILALIGLLIAVALGAHPKLASGGYYAAAALAALLFCAYILSQGRESRRLRRCLAWAAVSVHLFSLGWPLYANIGACQAFFEPSYSGYREEVREVTGRAALLEERDSGLFRSRLGGGVNGGMLYGYKDVAHFSSSELSELVNYLNRFGIAAAQDIWANSDVGSTRAFDSLFGIRYLVGGSDLSGYERLGPDLYEDPWALPLAFPASGQVLDCAPDSDDPFENLNLAFRSLCPELDLDVFRPAESRRLGQSGLKSVGEDEYAPDGSQEAGEIRYALTVDSTDPLCLYIRGGSGHAAEIYVNGEHAGNMDTFNTWRVLYLGSFQPGQELQIALRPAESDYYPSLMDRPLFCYESGDALAAYRAAVAGTGDCRIESGRDPRFRIETKTGEEGCLLLTVPYEEAWQLTVDGAPARAQRGLGMLLAVPLQPGEHTVELRYALPGLRAGTAISAATAALTAAALLFSLKKKKAS